MPDSLHQLPTTPQIKGLHTFIRNQETSRDEFIFYSNRLIRLVIEYALGLMPFKDVKVDTPQNLSYEGKRMACEKICGVSILRAGETMEQALCDVCKDIRIGKILIQTNQNTGEPEVFSTVPCPLSICDDLLNMMSNLTISNVLVILFKTAKRYKGLSCHIDGCNSCNGCCRNDGDSRFIRLRCSRRKYTASIVVNG